MQREQQETLSGSDATAREAVDGELVRLLEELCLWRLSRGDRQRAQELWEGLAELCPEGAVTQVLAGLLAYRNGRYREAEQWYRQVMERRPADASVRAFLAEALIAQQRWSEAESMISELFTRGVDPESDPGLALAAALQQGLDSGLFRRDSPARRMWRSQVHGQTHRARRAMKTAS